VFADLELPDAEEMQAKALLSIQIHDIIKRRHLTQAQAAELLGIDQPKVSALIRGPPERLFHGTPVSLPEPAGPGCPDRYQAQGTFTATGQLESRSSLTHPIHPATAEPSQNVAFFSVSSTACILRLFSPSFTLPTHTKGQPVTAALSA
jgi:transcriptional regulator, XRE family